MNKAHVVSVTKRKKKEGGGGVDLKVVIFTQNCPIVPSLPAQTTGLSNSTYSKKIVILIKFQIEPSCKGKEKCNIVYFTTRGHLFS